MNLSHYAQPAKLRTLLLVTTVLVSMLALLAPKAQAARATVRAGDEEWTPAVQRIERGDYIVWKNPTQQTHNIVAYGSNWSLDRFLYAGDSFTKRFRSTGTFKYLCSIHGTRQDGVCDGMCGVIRVVRP